MILLLRLYLMEMKIYLTKDDIIQDRKILRVDYLSIVKDKRHIINCVFFLNFNHH
jgi:hypothetical protein